MLALCGFPIFFSGFWSKDGILEAAQHWAVIEGPVLSARLRRAAHRVLYDAPGLLRLLRLLARPSTGARKPEGDDAAARHPRLLRHGAGRSSELRPGRGSTRFLKAAPRTFSFHGFAEPGLLWLMATSSLVVFLGLGLGWWLYGNKSPKPEEPDALEKSAPWLWAGASRSPLRRRVLRRHGDRLLRVVGARGRLARPPRLGRHRGRWSRGSSASGRSSIACSTSTGSTAASTKPARSFPQAAACWRACRAAACRTTCAFLPWPSSRWPQFFSGAAGHERICDRISDSDAPHRAAARWRGHRALRRQARARRGAAHLAGLPRRRAHRLDPPARRRKHRPRRARSLGALARHRVSPRRRRPRRAHARALRHRHAHVGRCGASRAPHARPLLRPGAHRSNRASSAPSPRSISSTGFCFGS